ncbi:MAG: alpha/beta hydrolase [bacterium]|nr:alpha/beta hydrolase [bacterium]
MKSSRDLIIVRGQGTPVVMLHSALSSKLQWYQLISMLSPTHKAVAFDLYGYGDIAMPGYKDDYSLTDEVAWVKDNLRHVIAEHEAFHLVGHSYGGAVALRLAYELGEQILSISLFEPVAFHLLDESEDARMDAERMTRFVKTQFKLGQTDAASQLFIDHWNGPGTFAAFKTSMQELIPDNIKTLVMNNQALADEPMTIDDYRNIKAPMLLMAGDKSPYEAVQVSELLAAELPNARFQWVNGGHMTPATNPERVNGIICDFIR